MSNQQLTDVALRLPPLERVRLAQELWESVFSELVPAGDPEEMTNFEEAVRRAEDIDSGRVRPIPYEDILVTLRSRLQ